MRKTETYFLRVIPSGEALAAPVADLLRQHHPALCPRTIILAPSQTYSTRHPNRRFVLRSGQRTTPERTLVFGEDRLVVIEQHPDGSLNEILIPFEHLIQVKWAIILQYAYVSFSWIADQTLKTLKIEYNGVGDEIVRAELERLRRAQHCPQADAAVPPAMDWHAIADALPHKFNYYLWYAVIPGESVWQTLFQPEIGRARRSWRLRASEDRTLALTSEGIIVVDEAREWMNFGVVIHYFPLRSIRGVRFEPASDRVWLRLSVGASGVVEETSMPFSDQNARCLRDGLQRFSPSIPVVWASEAV